MSKTNQNSLRITQIIYGALIFGVSLFLMYVVLSNENLFYKVDFNDIFTIVVPIMTLIGIVGNMIVYNKFMNTIKQKDDIKTKLGIYQTANLIRAAVLEAPAFLGVVATFLSGNNFFLLFAGFSVLVMLYFFPNQEKFKQDAHLTFREISELNSD